MTLHDFLCLDDELQYNAIWELGKHLKFVRQDGIVHFLYAINDFYIEVRYCELTHRILGKSTFKMRANELEKYLPKVELVW